MERWSIEDDRPYLRPARSSYAWLVFALAIAVAVSFGYFYYHYLLAPQEEAPAPTLPAGASVAPPPEAVSPPAIRHPLPASQTQAATSLPGLDSSDPMMRQSLPRLIGRKAFDELVIPDQLIRRIVATIDNLPRSTAPRRMIPLAAVPGAFVTAGTEADETIAPANFARYTPYVRVMESVVAEALVYSYVQAYPLFQRAYEELGYPGQYFNDRLIEAIDDMLAAPELRAPVPVMRPKVLYELADPDLETRSAGQKIMIRMGTENELRVKTNLRGIRRELIAASQRSP